MDLKGKCVLLGVSGGIAAYKMANVASALRKLGADVEVIMTRNATQFITPVTFETLTGHKCMVDTFDRDFKFEVTHISLAKKADVILVARPPPTSLPRCSRHRRRYAYHRRSRGQVSQARLPCHEHRDAGKPHHPGQHRHTGKVRLHGHPVRERRAGLQGRGQRTPAERGSPAGLHLPRIEKPKDLAGLRIAVTAGPTQEPLDLCVT